MSTTVLRTQLSGVGRRPARLLLTGLAVLVAAFVVFAAVLAQQIVERTALAHLSGTPAEVAFVVGEKTSATPADLTRIRALPGVAEAVGRFAGGGSLEGAATSSYLQVSADPGSGPLALVRATQGRYPQAANEIAVTPRTASRMGLSVGTVVALRPAPDARPVNLTVTGVVDTPYDFGGQAYAPEATVAALTPAGAGGRIEVRLADGASAPAVRSAIQAALSAVPRPKPEGSATPDPAPEIRTGAEVRAEEANRAVGELKAVFVLIGMFVGVAVVAAALVAASTFRIVFAQRMRQLALLRAIGAERGRIARALTVEGTLTGLVAGTTGVLAALGVGHGVPLVLKLLGLQVARPGVPWAAALAVIIGAALLTAGAVLAPAAAAARTAPLAALRDAQTTAARRDIGVFRLVVGVLLAAGAGLSALLLISRLPGREPPIGYSPAPMLGGIVASGSLAFFALMLLGPLLVRPMLRLVSWLLRGVGPVGRLAVGGIGGAPRRAAAISMVVALGVTLITAVLVGSASLRVLADRELAIAVPADFELTAGGAAITPATVEQVRSRSELTHVTPYRRLDKLALDGQAGGAYDANDLQLRALPTLGQLDVRAGSLADAGPGRIVIDGSAADTLGKGVGDQITLTHGGHRVELRIAAILPGVTPLRSSVVVDSADLDRLGAPAAFSGILADAARSGEDGRTAGQQALRGIADSSGGLGLAVLADARDQAMGTINALVAIALGLISLTVLIAVVGVGTTTALSVVERIRESGLLRAVGMSRAGLRAMLTTESSLYGVLGATLGLLLGVPYAWLTVRALAVNAPTTLPVLPLAGAFVVMVGFAALAGVLPARRASRVSPVAALGTGD
ncbi:FtsX-like permease family protein [Micromonospora sp. NPDC005806]|uniref:FtsX-like permease family protein n=1 Tax=Micromonospora sp. NPDC005806 TaxID=3364234 RepID=UPI00368C228D